MSVQSEPILPSSRRKETSAADLAVKMKIHRLKIKVIKSTREFKEINSPFFGEQKQIYSHFLILRSFSLSTIGIPKFDVFFLCFLF